MKYIIFLIFWNLKFILILYFYHKLNLKCWLHCWGKFLKLSINNCHFCRISSGANLCKVITSRKTQMSRSPRETPHDLKPLWLIGLTPSFWRQIPTNASSIGMIGRIFAASNIWRATKEDMMKPPPETWRKNVQKNFAKNQVKKSIFRDCWTIFGRFLATFRRFSRTFSSFLNIL